MLETRFENRSAKAQTIYFPSSNFVLDPQRQIDVEMEDKNWVYSKYEEVIFTDKGIKLKKRKDWNPPVLHNEFEITVEFLNEGGSLCEQIILNDLITETVTLPKGVPVVAIVDIENEYAKFKTYKKKQVVRREELRFQRGFFQKVLKIEWQGELRSKTELKRIEALIEKREAMRAKKIAEQKSSGIKNEIKQKEENNERTKRILPT